MKIKLDTSDYFSWVNKSIERLSKEIDDATEKQDINLLNEINSELNGYWNSLTYILQQYADDKLFCLENPKIYGDKIYYNLRDKFNEFSELSAKVQVFIRSQKT